MEWWKILSKYTILHVNTKLEQKKWKNAKKWNEHGSPLGGWGAGSKEPTQKRFNFIIIGYNISKLKYQKPLGPYTGWN